MRDPSFSRAGVRNAYETEVPILGDDFMARDQGILPKIREHVHKHAQTPWGRPRIIASKLAMTLSAWRAHGY